jgi:hypothetical protein
MNAEIREPTSNKDFINKYWEVLAACAWNEYRAHGRGALVIGAFAKPDESIYLPMGMLTKNPLLEEVRRFAEEYDPCQEVVAIFLRSPSGVSAYRGGIPERGTPPELYERRKAVLDTN